MRKNIGYLQHNLSWEEIKILVSGEYNMTIRDCCKLLKVSRHWVADFIRPHCRYIYIAPKAAAALCYAGVISCMDSVWMNRQDVIELVIDSISSITRQTICVYGTELVPSHRRTDYLREYGLLHEKLLNNAADGKLSAVKTYERKISEAVFPYLSRKQAHLLDKALENVDCCQRSLITPSSVSLPCKNIEEWVAVHDIKGYGDTDETIYRQLYRKGAVRIVVSLEQPEGENSEKIYYFTPPGPDGKGYTYLFDAGIFSFEKFKKLY